MNMFRDPKRIKLGLILGCFMHFNFSCTMITMNFSCLMGQFDALMRIGWFNSVFSFEC